jgi:mRNA-degrading endonuclease RelE of RelBE toxin-antitoxin system
VDQLLRDDRGSMELEINSAIKAQLSTLPKADQSRAERVLKRVAENPRSPSSIKRRLTSDPDLWLVRLNPKLRALVRIADTKMTVLAVARDDQLMQDLPGNSLN